MKSLKLLLLLSMLPLAAAFAGGDTLRYKLETSANVSTGDYALCGLRPTAMACLV